MAKAPAAAVGRAAADAEVIDLSGEMPEAAAPADPDVAVVVGDDEGDKLPRHARLQEDGSVILPLHFPVTFKWKAGASDRVREEHHAELHMHRLTGVDMRAVGSAGEGKAVTVGIARSARMTPATFNLLYDRMDAADAVAASEVFAFFLGGGRRAGR